MERTEMDERDGKDPRQLPGHSLETSPMLSLCPIPNSPQGRCEPLLHHFCGEQGKRGFWSTQEEARSR